MLYPEFPSPSQLRAAIALEQEKIRNQYSEIAQASESVIQIIPYKNQAPSGFGSGTAIEGGYVLTAEHIASGGEKLMLHMHTGKYSLSSSYEGDRACANRPIDAAVIPLPDVFKGYIPLRPLAKHQPKNDEWIYLVGFPIIDYTIDWPVHKRLPTIHRAQIMATERLTFHVKTVNGSLGEVPNGLSGGAALNEHGEMIGIPVASFGMTVDGMSQRITVQSLEAIQKGLL